MEATNITTAGNSKPFMAEPKKMEPIKIPLDPKRLEEAAKYSRITQMRKQMEQNTEQSKGIQLHAMALVQVETTLNKAETVVSQLEAQLEKVRTQVIELKAQKLMLIDLKNTLEALEAPITDEKKD